MQTATYQTYYNVTSASIGSMCMAFMIESIQAMIPWIITMFAIILCDLISGITRSVKMGISVRFSKAIRDTFMKATAYFFSIVAFCMVEIAIEHEMEVAKWVCLTFCFIEGCSILSNILKWHGYTINFNKLVGVVLKKKYDIEIGESDGILEKSPEPKKKQKR